METKPGGNEKECEKNRPVPLLEELIVYTDGACFRNGKEDAQASLGTWFGKSIL